MEQQQDKQRVELAEQQKAQELALQLAKKRILVIDDDLTLRPFLRSVVSQIDFHIQMDWESSVTKFLERESLPDAPPLTNYDLVLVDIYMPDKGSGLDVLKYLSKWAPTVPVVMMSGLSRLEFFKAVDGEMITPPYLEKPLRADECRSMIHGILLRNIVGHAS